MNISDDLLCLYSARITEQENTYTVEVPKGEVQQGNLQSSETYRVALMSSTADESVSGTDAQDEKIHEPKRRQNGAHSPAALMLKAARLCQRVKCVRSTLRVCAGKATGL